MTTSRNWRKHRATLEAGEERCCFDGIFTASRLMAETVVPLLAARQHYDGAVGAALATKIGIALHHARYQQPDFFWLACKMTVPLL